jgi:hypothetical protein
MSKLQNLEFFPLPLGSVHPLGWLKSQLRLQADGISGHLDEFWPDIQHSRWFGGDREGWERAPYWLDGLVPLAYLLDDAALKQKVNHYLDFILTHQAEDGWLGPRSMVQAGDRPEEGNYDLWGQMLATKVLVQYHEATGDPRTLAALEKTLLKIDRHIDTSPLFNWGQFRWFEALIAIFYLYEHSLLVPHSQPDWLLQLAVKLHAQGFDWVSFFNRWPLTEPTPRGRWNYAGHVVNNAMAPKGPGLWWRVSGEARDRKAVYQIIEQLDQYHGMVTGVFSGDECLAGLNPLQGTELCAVVEYMYSLEVLLSIFGDPAFGDRLEKIAFNALPATFSPDMWAHQYDQQVNQVECSVRENRTWNTNGPASNIFGVDPNYGCCTSNLSQGWSKFAANLWMQTQSNGLALVAYAPSQVKLLIKGVPVTAKLETEYPFNDTLHLSVNTDRPLNFPLYLRIPTWADRPLIQVDNETAFFPPIGEFTRLERTWDGTSRITIHLPMKTRPQTRPSGAIAISRGPLIYALKIAEDWRRINADQPYRELPHADWEVYPTSPWNYALKVSAETLDKDVIFHQGSVGERPFSPEGAPVTAELLGQRVTGWTSENGSALPAPASPIESDQPLEKLTLIPYGCTNLRISEFPVLSIKS